MINPDFFASNESNQRDPSPNEAIMWQQASGELLSFANHLEKTGAEITAKQIRLAVYRANRLTPDGRSFDVGLK